MKPLFLLLFIAFSEAFCQNTYELAIKKVAEYSDTTLFYFPYSSPFSHVFVLDQKKTVKIELWSLMKSNGIEIQDRMLDKYEFMDIDSGKYLFLLNRENSINYKGMVIMFLYYDKEVVKTIIFTKN